MFFIILIKQPAHYSYTLSQAIISLDITNNISSLFVISMFIFNYRISRKLICCIINYPCLNPA